MSAPHWLLKIPWPPKKSARNAISCPISGLIITFVGDKGINIGQLNELYSYNLGLVWDDKYGNGEGIANTSHKFSAGTFIIDLVSPEGNRLIWRGSVPTSIERDKSEDKNRQLINKAVEVILDSFPPENFFKSLKMLCLSNFSAS